MSGQHLPADHSRGDERTLGGYMAVHARPAAFEGADGRSYSADIGVDTTGDAAADRRYGAYLFFVQWSAAPRDPQVTGHLESHFLAFAGDADAARAGLGAWTLVDVRRALDQLIAERAGALPHA